MQKKEYYNLFLLLLYNNVNKIMFSVTTPTQIKDNPLNTSSAKNHWSFSKASRFRDPNPNCKVACYLNSSTLSARKASIGYGNRSAYFQGRKDSVDPGAYNTLTIFDINKSKAQSKGYNFGYNRDQLNFSNYLSVYQKSPGPTGYQINQQQIRGKKAYSLRPKTSYPKNYFLFSDPEERRVAQEPGPAQYNSIDCIGDKFLNSKCKNSRNTTLNGGKRFHKEKTTPGPADYNISHSIEADGNCLLSTMRGSGRRAIMNDKRQLMLKGNKYTPGPGTYRQPSDFGHYQKSIRPQTARR